VPNCGTRFATIQRHPSFIQVPLRRFPRRCINLALLAILAIGIESLGSKSQSWLTNGVILLTGRRIAIAVILSIAVVFGLAGWRWFSGAAEKPQIAKPAAPVAKPATPAVAATETPALLNQLESTQQNVVDDLQFMQSRVAKQDAEIKRLRAELDTLSQRYDTLSSFASTPKEAKAEPAVQPPKKKKKRVFVRRSVKKKPAA
jgi:hypothetical protein